MSFELIVIHITVIKDISVSITYHSCLELFITLLSELVQIIWYLKHDLSLLLMSHFDCLVKQTTLV